jgi:hypothetical protein
VESLRAAAPQSSQQANVSDSDALGQQEPIILPSV